MPGQTVVGSWKANTADITSKSTKDSDTVARSTGKVSHSICGHDVGNLCL